MNYGFCNLYYIFRHINSRHTAITTARDSHFYRPARPFLRPHVAVAYIIDNQRVREMPPFASQKTAFQRLVDGLSESKRPSIGKRDYKIPYQRYNKIKYS